MPTGLLVIGLLYVADIAWRFISRWRSAKPIEPGKLRLLTLRRALVLAGLAVGVASLFANGLWWKIVIAVLLVVSVVAIEYLDWRSERRAASKTGGSDWLAEPYGTRRKTQSETTDEGNTTEWIQTRRGRDATVKPPTVEVPTAIPTPTISVTPVDPGPELPDRELTPEEEAFLFAPSDRPDEPITAGSDRPPTDPKLSVALGRARKTAAAVQDLLDEVHLPPLDVLRDMKKSAIWSLEQEQATLGRYMNRLHGHVLVAVDGLRPWASHQELDRLYRNPRNTGDLRMIAKLLDVVADVAMPPGP